MSRYRPPTWVPAIAGAVIALITGLFAHSLPAAIVVAVGVGMVFLAAYLWLRPYLEASEERRRGQDRGA